MLGVCLLVLGPHLVQLAPPIRQLIVHLAQGELCLLQLVPHLLQLFLCLPQLLLRLSLPVLLLTPQPVLPLLLPTPADAATHLVHQRAHVHIKPMHSSEDCVNVTGKLIVC